MQVIITKAGLRDHLDAVRVVGRTVGLVPTMGALHEGHLSLVRAAAAECDVITLTIFVNPLQFGAGEDLDAYPRPLERDLELAEGAGVDVVFAPAVEEMYPAPTATTVHVDGLTVQFEGASRPTHFDGVTTVVAKLFNIAGPCRAYFGEKDFQQLAVVTRMVEDLDMPVTVVGCPILRESDGVAMSSRNAYLSPAERAAATVVNRSLRAGVALIEAGECDPAVVAAHIGSIIDAEPLAELDYAAVVDPVSLEIPTELEPGTTLRLLVVAKMGTPRLLDNLGVGVPWGSASAR
jgi:pantoate--beta-alanine ligase